MEIGADNKDKIAERRFAEMNQTLRKEHLLQQDYYKELLDVQSCGVMAYTLPGHRIVHMNAEALRMYGYYDLILMDAAAWEPDLKSHADAEDEWVRCNETDSKVKRSEESVYTGDRHDCECIRGGQE